MEAALEAGNAVIVIATEPHRTSLIQRLRAHGADVVTAIEQRRYIPLDAAETLATFMVNDVPDPYQFQKAVGDLFAAAAKGANGERRCVAACGEGAPTLWAEGKGDAAVQIELLRHADDALRRVVTAIPPSTDDVAAAQLIQAHDRVRRCARKGRDLARRLSALVAAQ